MTADEVLMLFRDGICTVTAATAANKPPKSVFGTPAKETPSRDGEGESQEGGEGGQGDASGSAGAGSAGRSGRAGHEHVQEGGDDDHSGDYDGGEEHYGDGGGWNRGRDSTGGRGDHAEEGVDGSGGYTSDSSRSSGAAEAPHEPRANVRLRLQGLREPAAAGVRLLGGRSSSNSDGHASGSLLTALPDCGLDLRGCTLLSPAAADRRSARAGGHSVPLTGLPDCGVDLRGGKLLKASSCAAVELPHAGRNASGGTQAPSTLALHGRRPVGL